MSSREEKIHIAVTGGLNTEQPGGLIAGLDPVLEVPYLTQAHNVVFEEAGAFRKIGGALIATQLVLGEVKAVLPASGVTGTSDFYTVEDVNGIRGWTLDTTDGVIATTFNTFDNTQLASTAYSEWTVSEFEGQLIFASDDSTIDPLLLDPVTFASTALVAGFPHFSMSTVYQNRLWVAGDPDNPSRLYYSDLNDPTQGYAANFFDIDPFSKARITALHVHKGVLFIFKGPRKGSIHILSGRTVSTFAIDQFSATIGCPGPNALVDFQNNVMFMDAQGHIRTIAATQAFGDFETTIITDPIRGLISNDLNKGELAHTVMHNDSINSRVWVQVPTGDKRIDRSSIIVDYKLGLRLSTADWITASHIVPARANTTALGTERLIASQGEFLFAVDEVGKERIESFSINAFTLGISRLDSTDLIGQSTAVIASNPYCMYVELPTIKFFPAMSFSNITNVEISTKSVSVPPLGKETITACDIYDPTSSFTFRWFRDLGTLESTTLNQTFGSRLGSVCVVGPLATTLPSDGSIFTLGASRLGGPKVAETYAELETSEFRRIAFAFEQGGLNQGLHVHSFAISVAGGRDHGSTENLI